MAGKAVGAFFLILVCGIIGIVLSIILQLVIENEYVVIEDAAAQLPGIQIILIVVWLLVGCLLAAFKS